MMRPFLLALLLAGPASALTPLPACENVTEAGMQVLGVGPLGGPGASSGAIVEAYGVAYAGGAAGHAPLPELEGFGGTRVTDCATGDFLVVSGRDPYEVGTALAATEFLRGTLAADGRVRFAGLRRAAEALYGPVLALRETGQTCGCAVHFDASRPSRQTPFAERADVRQGSSR